MKAPSRRKSTSRHIICPACGSSELRPRGPDPVAGCDSCGRFVEGAIFRTLEQIASLPDVVGSHTCEECSHPEMRRLPDGVYHCPACGSEVLPTEVSSRRQYAVTCLQRGEVKDGETEANAVPSRPQRSGDHPGGGYVQRFIFRVLTKVARLLGYRAEYPYPQQNETSRTVT
jgi:ribosomal protein L37AE/L43A